MIWFDDDESWGSAGYQVQKLFMTNVGDRVVPSRAVTPAAPAQPITGAVGLSTWATAARYDDVRVTAPDGTVLFADDFSAGAGQWTPLATAGDRSIVDGAYAQSDTAAQNTLVKGGDIAGTDYDITLTATKTAGAEGFLIAFGVKDLDNTFWWNLGGWNNTHGAVEKISGGAKEQLITRPDTIETGRAYALRIEVRGAQVRLLVDGQVWGSFTGNPATQPFAQVVTHDEAAGELIVKVVNAQAGPAETTIDLGGRPVFTHTFDPYSVTFLRLGLR